MSLPRYYRLARHPESVLENLLSQFGGWLNIVRSSRETGDNQIRFRTISVRYWHKSFSKAKLRCSSIYFTCVCSSYPAPTYSAS